MRYTLSPLQQKQQILLNKSKQKTPKINPQPNPPQQEQKPKSKIDQWQHVLQKDKKPYKKKEGYKMGISVSQSNTVKEMERLAQSKKQGQQSIIRRQLQSDVPDLTKKNHDKQNQHQLIPVIKVQKPLENANINFIYQGSPENQEPEQKQEGKDYPHAGKYQDVVNFGESSSSEIATIKNEERKSINVIMVKGASDGNKEEPSVAEEVPGNWPNGTSYLEENQRINDKYARDEDRRERTSIVTQYIPKQKHLETNMVWIEPKQPSIKQIPEKEGNFQVNHLPDVRKQYIQSEKVDRMKQTKSAYSTPRIASAEPKTHEFDKFDWEIPGDEDTISRQMSKKDKIPSMNLVLPNKFNESQSTIQEHDTNDRLEHNRRYLMRDVLSGRRETMDEKSKMPGCGHFC